jgi:hypothetical protein
MEDKTYGWTVEMQLVLKQNVLCRNSVRYKIEWSFKVSGTVKGSVMAGKKNNRMDFQIHF